MAAELYDAFFDRYMRDLRWCLRQLPPNLQPTAEQVREIVEKERPELDRIVAELSSNPRVTPAIFQEDDDKPLIQNADFIDDITRGLGGPIPDPVPAITNTGCVAAHMAIGAAILAAWVASGGTLAIGSVVAGVTITDAIAAALAGGASGYVIAQILCQ
jgi:hypothetical protein